MIEDSSSVNRLALTVLTLFTIGWIAQWALFPVFLDPAYHLSIGQQIVEANGIFILETKEFAPVGRPHIYPPVLHLIIAGFLKIGLDAVSALRLLSVIIIPIFLFSLWSVVRRLFNPSLAMSCLVVSIAPFGFHIHATMALAAALGMIELLWFVDACEHKRYLAAGVLLALLFYTHLVLPWVALVAIGLYSIVRSNRRAVFIRASWGIVLALPWIMHIWNHRLFIQSFERMENQNIDLVPMIFIFAIIGMIRCLYFKGRFFLPVVLYLAFLPFSIIHQYRWLSGEGMLPVILLAGVGMEGVINVLRKQSVGVKESFKCFWDPVSRFKKPISAISVIVWVALMMSPTLIKADTGKWRPLWLDSSVFHLTNITAMDAQRSIVAGYAYESLQKIAQVVALSTDENDVLWSNAPYALGFMAAVAKRPMASAMLDEVRPFRPFNPIDAAQVMILFKFDQKTIGNKDVLPIDKKDIFVSDFQQVESNPEWSQFYENELVLMYRSNSEKEKAKPLKRVLPLSLSWVIIAGMLFLIGFDYRRFVED